MYNNETQSTRVISLFKKRRSIWRNLPDRNLMINIPDMELPNNKISTSKYSFATFFPKNLFIQFSKIANLYFLVTYFTNIFLKKIIFQNKLFYIILLKIKIIQE